MKDIDEVLKEVGFADWTDEEQSALSKMMYNFANKRSNHDVIGKTDRVLTTFIKILDRHLPENEG